MLTMVEKLQEHLRYTTFLAKQTGRTSKMMGDVITAIKKVSCNTPQLFLIVVTNRELAKDLKCKLTTTLKEQSFTVEAPLHTSIKIGSLISIDFITIDELRRYAGCHPSPVVFMDHFTEEQFIDKKLQELNGLLNEMKNRK